MHSYSTVDYNNCLIQYNWTGAHSLTHSPTHTLTPSLPYPLTHSPTHTLTPSLPYPLTPSPTHTLTHSPTHTLTPSLRLTAWQSEVLIIRVTLSLRALPLVQLLEVGGRSPANLVIHPTHPPTCMCVWKWNNFLEDFNFVVTNLCVCQYSKIIIII